MSKRRRRTAVGKLLGLREAATATASGGDESDPQSVTRPTPTVAVRRIVCHETLAITRMRNDG